VGAIGDDSFRGAVHVYVQSGDSFEWSKTLTAPNAENGDRFGSALAAANGRLLVGADGESSASAGIQADRTNNAAEYAGCAFLYRF